jgi:uncharacterized protein (DUF1499 family)
MKTLAVIIVLLLIVGAASYALLEKRPGYGVYYGLAKLTGSRLDIGPVDWATLTRHPTPNDALFCPASHCPRAKPDREPPVYALEPSALLARLKDVVRADANTAELYCGTDCGERARLIQYTRLMRYPDTIDIAVFPATDGSTLAIYSRSLVGRGDFGVNRARIERWLAALPTS